MKRDMDLIRQLLLRIESSDRGWRTAFDICGYGRDETNYNLELLISQGFVDGSINRLAGGNSLIAVRQLTWNGHELLDAIRSESIWAKTKEHIKAKGFQSVPIELVMSTAIKIAKELL